MTGGYYDHQLELLSETLLCDLRPGEMVVMEPEMQHRMPASWYDRYETASSGQNDNNMALQHSQGNLQTIQCWPRFIPGDLSGCHRVCFSVIRTPPYRLQSVPQQAWLRGLTHRILSLLLTIHAVSVWTTR